MSVGGCERDKALSGSELELFAEFEVLPLRKIDVEMGCRRVAVGAELANGLEVRAVFAPEAKRENTRFVAQPGVDRRFH